MTRRAAKNFYYGIRLLPRPKRRALCAVYAWSRLCDDAVDEPGEAGADPPADRLAGVRAVLERARGDGYDRDQDPVVLALGDAMRRFRLPLEPFVAILRGMEMDLRGTTYETFAQLRQYCECVAGAVGHLCLEIFGYTDPEAPELGVEMGVALQLTNVLRDLREDVGLGRVYLPREEIEAAGYSVEDLRALRRTPAFDRLMAQQVARARTHYERSERLFSMVVADARLCLMVLHGVYRELLAHIEASGYDVMSRRIRVSTTRKVQLVGALLLRNRQVRTGRA